MTSLETNPTMAEVASETLKALAHPIRLRIIALLSRGDLNVTELADHLEVPQAIISQQLRILRMRRLVRARRESGFALYALTEPGLINMVHCIESCKFCQEAATQRISDELS